jgi:6-phosphogluconate dehydrogenase
MIEVGFVGLGRMGFNMATRLLQGGHRVVAYNRTMEKVNQLAEKGVVPAQSLIDVVNQLQSSPRIVWLMLPAGPITDKHIEQLQPQLKAGDILIDGGNAYYKDSIRRAEQLKKHGIHFLDAGVSGGIWGLKNGYCIMVGGEEEAFKHAAPLFKTLAPKDGYAHMGKNGSGHFVKMVHNGIEYGLLQAYGEGFALLKGKEDFDLNLQSIAKLWNQGSVVQSWLLELAEKALSEKESFNKIRPYVEDSGEGRWTVLEGVELSIPLPVISLSLMERFRSRLKESFSDKMIAALRQQFGGHAVLTSEMDENNPPKQG